MHSIHDHIWERNALRIKFNTSTKRNFKFLCCKIGAKHIHKLSKAQVGDTVQVPVHDLVKCPYDLIHVLAYITKINKDHMPHQLATKHGIIQGKHSRNTYHIFKQKLLKLDDMNLTLELSLRAINEMNSISGGQWFLRCNCAGACSKNSFCRKAGVTCNSKCHKKRNDTSYTNK